MRLYYTETLYIFLKYFLNLGVNGLKPDPCFIAGYPQNLTAPSGDIKSPNFPDSYDANQHCVWNISVADRTGLHVELKFLKFNISGSMPDCESGDYLEVFLGSGFDSIGRFCGGISPPTVYSPDGCMKLVFHSDGKTSNVGFHAAYSLRPLNQGTYESQVYLVRH